LKKRTASANLRSGGHGARPDTEVETPMRRIVCAGVLGLMATAGAGLLGAARLHGQDAPPAAKPDGAAAGPRSMFEGLVQAIEKSEGCLGVETARTRGGKALVFAWFEDKAAALKWYHGATHRRVMGMMGTTPREDAMSGVPDEGPVMVVAAVTMGGEPNPEAGGMPISQISIELYRPLPGGASMGGRFSPEKLAIPGHRSAEYGGGEAEAPATKP
jgi:heme-degrading monooxygenase HmoA